MTKSGAVTLALHTWQINRLVKKKPSALKGVVTEAGPGPVAPDYNRSTNSLPPLQFQHPQVPVGPNSACFERKRVNADSRVQISTKPANWSVTLGQFYAFCEHCFADPMYTVIKNASSKQDIGYTTKKTRELKKMREQDIGEKEKLVLGECEELPGKRVNAYDMDQFFVRPWTAGCNMGVALMTNAKPKPCHVMISHAWGEDMESLYTTLKEHEQQNAREFNENTRIWFCLFAIYQGAGAARCG